MLNPEPTIPLGAEVSYTPDPRVKGLVVGYGTVHNGSDPTATGDAVYHVVIVKLHKPETLGNVAASNFHVPFVPAVLKILKETASA